MQQDQVTEELKEAYRKFTGSADDTEEGFNLNQLQETMQESEKNCLTDREFQQLFDELDADGDGKIDFTDFVRGMMMRGE